MTSAEIRQKFLDFFKERGHQIVPSAPMVVKNDPTLMFINSGMAPFKEWFLGQRPVQYPRVADTQKCLRVSGKHNDLEEVGIDTYHHTMFEMLGNWSFGDYFKKEAIAWSWELLTKEYGLSPDRLYVTVFEGDTKEHLAFDQESYDCWKEHISEDRILKGNKKDNFWEMGDTGPCGPCSEIHIDLRGDTDRKKTDGKSLVNSGHAQVIEIWNNVFMEFNRKADGSLEPLPSRHVDTGMGFERLCMALQGKQSNYDTDVFQPLIQFLAGRSGIRYGADEKTDIAMRVMADHVRAITCAVADGQLPSNNKAGYVIRRILRRAVRYGFTFLNFREPVLSTLVPILAEQFKNVFPEIHAQQEFIARVIAEEEHAFLRTLEAGIRRFDEMKDKRVSGEFAFELYDTYGFPVDLTQLMAREKDLEVDMEGFHRCLQEQKERSRAASQVDAGDWIDVLPDVSSKAVASDFVGYDELECPCRLLRYRKVKTKNKEQVQLVLSRTPFYAESGGQVGDTGTLRNTSTGETVVVTDTQKENNLIIHFADRLPADVSADFHAAVDAERRRLITAHHSATHLMHSALKRVLGTHVNQKGSLVNDHVTRFDFSHFAKVTPEELQRIEHMVNRKIREDIALDEQRDVPIDTAMNMGATALFGEKYGERVRVITFDPSYSRELCGGTHVAATGQIGLFKIISESAVAAGVRRVEAVVADVAEADVLRRQQELENVSELLKHPKDLVKGVQALLDARASLEDQLKQLLDEKARRVKEDLLTKVRPHNGLNVLIERIDLSSSDAIKNISFELKHQVDNLFCLLASEVDGKPMLSMILSDNLVRDKQFNASVLIRDLAKEISGGGGGQAFYATAGGKDVTGLARALEKARSLV